jgi:hypothetical protein
VSQIIHTRVEVGALGLQRILALFSCSLFFNINYVFFKSQFLSHMYNIFFKKHDDDDDMDRRDLYCM